MKKWTADFETTTDIDDCRVWAFGVFQIGSQENFQYGNSMEQFILWCKAHDKNTLYFHNLKFDGEFILDWLFRNDYKCVNLKKPDSPKTFTTLISDKGLFYSLCIMFDDETEVTIYDSLKILPFSVEQIAEGFGLPISKLKIDYNEKRDVGHELTKQEVDYLRNDVEIVAKALHVLFEQNLTKMTQGSNAMFDFKRIFTKKKFEKAFPPPDFDKDIRQSYKGGFTYLKEGLEDVDIQGGIVLDVNSLYPSVMYDRPMPYGEGVLFQGKYKKDKDYPLFIQMLRCQFKVKDGFIPTIQIKNSLSFQPNLYLKDSGEEPVTLCLTSPDLKLFLTHYDVYNLEYINGWKFKASTGMFKDYIDKWMGIKVKASEEGNESMRTLAKLMLNALYGKFATSPEVQSKIPFFDEQENHVRYRLGEKELRKTVYLPVGTFITAWARYKTITSAQKVFPRFIYADTDSLHLMGSEIPKGLDVHPTKLGAWKHESTFQRARFLRQKAYIEKTKTLKDNAYEIKLNVTCAGLPHKLHKFVTWDNFHVGMEVYGKLTPVHTPGGIVLTETSFQIR